MKKGQIIKNPAGDDRKVLDVRTEGKTKEYFVSDDKMGEPNVDGRVIGKWFSVTTLKEKGFTI